MASLTASRPASLIPGLPPRASSPMINAIKLCTRASPASSRLRFECTTRQQINRRRLSVSATNSSSAGQEAPNEEQSVNKTRNVAKGPPFLTILAGAFVFFIVCWVIGSIVMWLISLIVNVPSPK